MRTLHNLHTIDINPGQTGVTVRNGDKWADALNDKIELCECAMVYYKHASLGPSTVSQPPEMQHKIVGHGVVIEIWNGEFKNIPARYIEHEHEERSRMYSGLLESMRKAYGETFSEANHVTVLVYNRYD